MKTSWPVLLLLNLKTLKHRPTCFHISPSFHSLGVSRGMASIHGATHGLQLAQSCGGVTSRVTVSSISAPAYLHYKLRALRAVCAFMKHSWQAPKCLQKAFYLKISAEYSDFWKIKCCVWPSHPWDSSEPQTPRKICNYVSHRLR